MADESGFDGFISNANHRGVRKLARGERFGAEHGDWRQRKHRAVDEATPIVSAAAKETHKHRKHRLFTTERTNDRIEDRETLLLAHFRGAGREDGSNDAANQHKMVALAALAAKEAGLRADDNADLLVLAGDDGAPTRLYLRASHGRHDLLCDWFLAFSEKDGPGLWLDRAWGSLPGVVELWLDAPSSCVDAQKALCEAADGLLDLLLIGNRPVAQWRCHFLAPITPKAPARGVAPPALHWNVEQPDSQERSYFLPQAERLLGGEDGLRSWQAPKPDKLPIAAATISAVSAMRGQAPKPDKLSIAVESPLYETPLECPVEVVRRHQFGRPSPHSAQLLEWVLQPPAPEKSTSDTTRADTPAPRAQAWWRYLYDQQPSAWPLAKLIDFLAEARFVTRQYDHFAGPEKKPVKAFLVRSTGTGSEHIELRSPSAKVDGPNTLNLVTSLLEAVDAQGFKANAQGDDRARVIVSMVLEGGQPAQGAMERALALVNTVDPYSRAGFYDGSFAAEEFHASQYRRFWSQGSHFMATDHSFSFVGYRQCGDSDPKARSFAEKYIHPSHMNAMYRRLFLAVTFQHLALNDIGQRAARGSDWSRRLDEIAALRSDWVAARITRWFARVSTQVQGNELYLHLRAQAKIDANAADLDDQLEDLEAVVEHAHEKRSERTRNAIEIFGLPIATMLATKELTSFEADKEVVSLKPTIEHLDKLVKVHNENALWFGFSGIIACIVPLIVGFVSRYSGTLLTTISRILLLISSIFGIYFAFFK